MRPPRAKHGTAGAGAAPCRVRHSKVSRINCHCDDKYFKLVDDWKDLGGRGLAEDCRDLVNDGGVNIYDRCGGAGPEEEKRREEAAKQHYSLFQTARANYMIGYMLAAGGPGAFLARSREDLEKVGRCCEANVHVNGTVVS